MDNFTKKMIDRIMQNGSRWFFHETYDRELELIIIDKLGRIHTRLKLDKHATERFAEIALENLNKDRIG